MTSDSERAGAVGDRSRWVHCAVLAAVCALIVGWFGWSAKSGPMELCGLGADDSYYNLLVQGFRAGQLNLKREVPAGLAQLADPYDPGANRDYLMDDLYPMSDLSYYQGKLYLYFGVTPALVLFWPYAALSGRYLLHRDAVAIFCAVGFLASAGLLWGLWRRYFAEVGFGVVVAGVVALGLATLTPVILPKSDVYEVAIGCGYALTMLAVVAVWKALHEPLRRSWWLAAASLAYGLALGARPSLLFGAVILLAPVAQAWRERRRMGLVLLAATGPIVLIGLGLLLYNSLRFDNPLEFGQRYQLAAERQDTMQHFSARYLWFNFRLYYLAPARWSACFPFVHDIAVPPLPPGHGTIEHPFGVLTNIPLVWLALAAPLAWRRRLAEARATLGWFLTAVALLFGTNALTLGLYNYACIRYEVEFVPVLVLLAVIGVLGLERTLAGQPGWRRAARWGWGLALVFSVAFNLLVSVDYQAEAHTLLGRVSLSEGQTDEAITRFRRALALRPYDASTHREVGGALAQKGRVDEAIARFQRALEIRPNDPATHNELGVAFAKKGKPTEAIAHFQKALELKPDFAEAHCSLSTVLAAQGRSAEAIAHCQKALAFKGNYVKAHNNLGVLLDGQGRTAEAIAHFQKALELKPDYAEAHCGLALALERQGRFEQAIAHFQAVLNLEPGRLEVWNNLAWLLATCPEVSLRNGQQAVELAQQANQLAGGGNPIILKTLAAAYAEAGRFSDAVATAQQALQLAMAQNNTNLAGVLRDESQRYQGSRPLGDAIPTLERPDYR